MRLPVGALLLDLLAEMLLEGAQDAERRGEMDVEDGVPLLVAHLLDDRVPGVAGVVHHDMAVAEGVDRGLDDAVAEVGLGDVAVAGHRLAAHLLDLGDGLLGRRLVDVVDHHLGAVAHQAQRDLLADAASRAGDDRHLAVHLTHLSLLSSSSAWSRAQRQQPRTVAWPCSVSWPFWLVHLTSRSISFSPFSSRLPVTLPLRGDDVARPGDRGEARAEPADAIARRVAGDQPAEEAHRQHAVGEHVLEAELLGEVEIDMDRIVVARAAAIERELVAA